MAKPSPIAEPVRSILTTFLWMLEAEIKRDAPSLPNVALHPWIADGWALLDTPRPPLSGEMSDDYEGLTSLLYIYAGRNWDSFGSLFGRLVDHAYSIPRLAKWIGLDKRCHWDAKSVGYKFAINPNFSHVDHTIFPWRFRLAIKFANGTYKRPAFQTAGALNGVTPLTPIPGHFCHISANDDMSVCFVPDTPSGRTKAMREPPIFTVQKVGRYLAAFYPDLGERGRQKIVGAMDVNRVTLHFATTAKDIERVYTKGPSSCMRYPKSHWANIPVHPVTAYAGGDLAVAYLLQGVEALNSKDPLIAARCVCWPDKKTYGRIYGDHTRMAAALEKEGFSPIPRETPGFNGARLKAIPVDGLPVRDGAKKFVFPYVDWHPRVTLSKDEKYIFLGEVNGEGAKSVNQTAGGMIAFVPTQECACCHSSYPMLQMRTMGDVGLVCNRCRGDGMVYMDHRTGDYVRRDHAGYPVEVVTSMRILTAANGDRWPSIGQLSTWSSTSATTHAYRCASTGYYVSYAASPSVVVWRLLNRIKNGTPSLVWVAQTYAHLAAECYAIEWKPGVWVHRASIVTHTAEPSPDRPEELLEAIEKNTRTLEATVTVGGTNE